MGSPSDQRPASISSRAFAVSRKGFDPDEVRAYLGQLAEVVDRLTVERDSARADVSDLRAAAEVRPVLDEDQLTAALGEETARVLTSARRAATEIKERAEESVARMLREAAESSGQTRREGEADAAALRDEAAAAKAAAEADAARTREDADAAAQAARAGAEAAAQQLLAESEAVLSVRTAEAEEVARGIVAEAETDAESLRQAARDEAAAIAVTAAAERDAAQAEGREMVAEAQRVRERMLADLSRRRKAARVQLEQLQAARDRLLESYDAVQRTMDEATAGLRRALPDARSAADAARIRAQAEPEATVDQLEDQIAAARAAGLPLVAPGDTGETPLIDLTKDAADAAADADVLAGEPVTGEVDVVVIDDSVAGDEGSPEVIAEEDPTVEVVAVEVVSVETVTVEVVAAEPDPTASELWGGPEDDPELVVASPAAGGEDAAGAVVADAADDDVDAAEELFARLRASREPDADESTDVAATPATPDAAADQPPAEPEPEPESVPGFESKAEAEAESEPADGAEPEQDVLLTLLERRDGAVDPIETRVARRLKRALADEQGQVLDGVRREKGRADLAVLLPVESQLAAYVDAVADELTAAAEEGAAFEGASLPPSTSITSLADDLARDLVGVVRPRVERCFDGVEDADDVSDRLRATYREWKTDRLMEVSRHAVLAAFGRGQVAVRPAGTPVRWVADPSAPACPDCEDDALAGTVASGEAFPTGHTHPPAHPGCRCLVVDASVDTGARSPAVTTAR